MILISVLYQNASKSRILEPSPQGLISSPQKWIKPLSLNFSKQSKSWIWLFFFSGWVQVENTFWDYSTFKYVANLEKKTSQIYTVQDD